MPYQEIVYPLSIRDIAPAPDAERITGTRPDGLPDGFHTGGAWRVGDEVWKPLDGRPWANADCHVATREAEVLEFMAGQPLFPRNWRIEEANGRRFLVRKFAHVVDDFSQLDHDQLLYVERGVRALNAAGWEVNDALSLAFDLDSYELFLVDLSAVQPMTGTGAYAADEDWRLKQLFRAAGFESLARLRERARSVVANIPFLENKRAGFVHVYASFARPLGNWAKIPESVFVHTDGANWSESIPHTWVVTKEPLADNVCQRYELRYGWSPIPRKAKPAA